MAKTRARSQIRIPDDWDGESYSLVLACVPDSVLWKSAYLGAISTLGRGRFWDAETGSIKDAQIVGNEITDSVSMDCNQVFEEINESIKQLASSGGCCPTDVSGEPPVDPPPNQEVFDFDGPVPPGFGSWEDAFSAKCIL